MTNKSLLHVRFFLDLLFSSDTQPHNKSSTHVPHRLGIQSGSYVSDCVSTAGQSVTAHTLRVFMLGPHKTPCRFCRS